MDGKLTWNGMKKQLHNMGKEELLKLLKDLEAQKIASEVLFRAGAVDRQNSREAVSYHTNKGKGIAKIVDLRQVRHRIACIKTILSTKFGGVNIDG